MSGRSNEVAAGEAHRMASGAQTDPWGNFLGRSRHEYDSHAVTDPYPGPRSATWLRQLTHFSGHRYCRERDSRGNAIPERPNGRKFEEHREGTTYLAPHSVKPRICFDHLAVGASPSIEESLALFHGAATECIFAPSPSVDPRIAHARNQPHPKWAWF